MISRTTRSRRSSALISRSRPSAETSCDFSLCSRISRNSSSLCASSAPEAGRQPQTPPQKKILKLLSHQKPSRKKKKNKTNGQPTGAEQRKEVESGG